MHLPQAVQSKESHSETKDEKTGTTPKSTSSPRVANDNSDKIVGNPSEDIKTNELRPGITRCSPLERWLNETAKEEYWHTESRT
ncbi:hypothetical protein BU16DRAFT_561706 [Lophium mytilinum]|uniref:Uncharacterized protein n=1 Tax=Lophium mytilinum TaxID=390894 RepID=A0A6A6QTC2_9PEZI|nr:hypothetical protein BU16DRAFT_561706 [Lophium mytilinum]